MTDIPEAVRGQAEVHLRSCQQEREIMAAPSIPVEVIAARDRAVRRGAELIDRKPAPWVIQTGATGAAAAVILRSLLECAVCDGGGYLDVLTGATSEGTVPEREECPDCDGTGKNREVLEWIEIRATQLAIAEGVAVRARHYIAATIELLEADHALS